MAIGEFDLIARYFDRCVIRDDILLGIGDDAALVRPPAQADLAIATDTLVAGVHFDAGTPPRAIGHKALAVNLSDLAAMGAEPAGALLALTLPAADEAWLCAFADGFHALAARHGVALIGGDTCRGPLAITVTVLGWTPRGTGLRRAGARPGDALYASGTLGDAGLALALGEGVTPAIRERLHRPEPRVALGCALRDIASAAIDVSDGLLADLGHVLAASGVGATLDLDALPLSDALRMARDPQAAVHLALTGGDDYELLFSVAEARVGEVTGAAQRSGTPVTRIGTICADAGIGYRSAQGLRSPARAGGYQHF